MLHSLKYAVYVGLVAISVTSCSSTDCSGNRSSLPLAAFMSSEQTPQPITIDTLRIAGIGAPADSVLSVYGASQAYMPFNIESHSTSYVLRYNRFPEQLYDTISFAYDIDPWFESADCGVIYIYKVKGISYTTNLLDSVTCPGGIIDNTPAQNIFIYFKTED